MLLGQVLVQPRLARGVHGHLLLQRPRVEHRHRLLDHVALLFAPDSRLQSAPNTHVLVMNLQMRPAPLDLAAILFHRTVVAV